MTMNNSDFLSDAVALDLGKSGVKVAETLEIEVGEEWWRLINAAAVTEGKFFNNRSLPVPIVSGGELNLGMLDRTSLQMIGEWGMSFNRQKIHTIVHNDVRYFYSMASFFKYGSSFSSRARFKIWTLSGEMGDTEFTETTASASYFGGCFWDAANLRFIAAYYSGLRTYTIGSGMSSQAYINPATHISSDFWCTEVFEEDPGTVYSFFFSSAGGAKVKKTVPTVGVGATTLYQTVCMNTSSTALTAITGYSYSKGLHPFYLRSAESAGVAWIDDATGQIGYVLESESWGTARYLPLISGTLTDDIVGFGTSFIPSEGEFFLFTTRAHESGNVTKDVGYSFPENWAVMGAYPGGDDHMRVFGLVGTTVYGYDLTLSTMSLEYLGVADSSWAYGSRECTKVGESGDLDLLVFSNAMWDHTVQQHEILAVYNRASNAIVWKWTNFGSSALFPKTYMDIKNGGFFRYDDQLMFIRGLRSASTIVESYVLPISSVLACVDAAAVNTLLSSAGGRKSVTVSNSGNYMQFGAPGSINHCLTGLLHDDSFFYFLRPEGTYPTNTYLQLYRMSKDRTSATRLAYIVRGTGVDTNTKLGFRCGVQNVEGTYLYDNKIQDLASLDNMFHMSITTTISSTYPWSTRFWDPVNAPTTPNDLGMGITLGAVRTYGTTVLVPAIGNIGETVTYKSYGATTEAIGSSWDLSNRTGMGIDRWAAPFSPVKSYTDEWNDVTVYFGSVAAGELPYMKHSSLQGRLNSLHAIKVSDSSLYTIDLGHVCGGGMGSFNAYGSSVIYNSIAGMTYMVDTGALITDGMGGDVGGGGEATQYIFEYLDKEFIPYPFAREGIRAELSNISKTTKITLPETQDNLIRGMLAAGTDFRGSRCILRRVFPDHLDEAGSDIVLLDGYIQDWSYVPGKKGIAFSVSKTLIDVGAQFPKRLMNMGCSHVFKGSRCRYLGETGRCLKTKTFCTSLANQLQFGGFPWVAARQRRVMWK